MPHEAPPPDSKGLGHMKQLRIWKLHLKQKCWYSFSWKSIFLCLGFSGFQLGPALRCIYLRTYIYGCAVALDALVFVLVIRKHYIAMNSINLPEQPHQPVPV